MVLLTLKVETTYFLDFSSKYHLLFSRRQLSPPWACKELHAGHHSLGHGTSCRAWCTRQEALAMTGGVRSMISERRH